MKKTPWLKYFVDIVLKAQGQARKTIEITLKNARFFNQYKTQLKERQLKTITRMLQEGSDGFKGGMTAKKYIE